MPDLGVMYLSSKICSEVLFFRITFASIFLLERAGVCTAVVSVCHGEGWRQTKQDPAVG